MQKIVKIEGMGCAHCEAKVKKALEAIPEVESALASHTEKNAVVTLTAEIADSVLLDAVNALGKFKATEVVG